MARRIPDERGDTAAVVVEMNQALLHTKQFLAGQINEALDATDGAIDGKPLARLNIVAKSQATADAARRAVRERYPADARPAVSVVVGELPQQDALVGVDAVAIDAKDATGPGIMPPGPRVYVSGQAEKAASPAAAAAKTLASLKRTLEFAGATTVVQAKCFLTPMTAAADVVVEFEKAFGKGDVPPLVFVEWKSNLPIEIEMIAGAHAAKASAPLIEYLTPPGATASPLYARVVRVNRGDLIYTAGIDGAKPSSGEEQILSIFDQLQNTLKQSNSDLRHLAKATYYVSDDDASKKLNELRPRFYDPQRPPAASKAMVPGVGTSERSLSIDMIAVAAAKP
jgi:enamine deaminase RidA (YjgF/YER057c/UK114 family)